MRLLRPLSLWIPGILLALVLIMEQCCSPLCKQQFSRGSGIKRHRDVCSIFQNAERDRVVSRRKAHRNSIAPVSGRRPLRAAVRHPSQSPAFATPAYVATSSSATGATPAHSLQNSTVFAPSESPLAASFPGIPANIAETSDIPMTPLHEEMQPFIPPDISIKTPLLTRYGRAVRQPAMYRDQIPMPLPPVEDVAPQPRPLPRVRLIVRNPFETVANIFGLWRRYWHKPTYDPDAVLELRDLQNRPPQPPAELPFIRVLQIPADSRSDRYCSDRITEWLHRPVNEKTDEEVDHLVNHVILDPDFIANLPALKASNYHSASERKRLNKVIEDSESPFEVGSFKTTDIPISIPSGVEGKPPLEYRVPGLHYRTLTDVLKDALSDPLAQHYHYTPFELYVDSLNGSSDGTPSKGDRVYSEVYNSDVFIREHDHIQRHGKTENPCNLEKVVAAIMLWSDSTHLANFGTAKLWPIYLLLGNLSKYMRAQQTHGAVNHVAYIPSLPDFIKDFLAENHPRWNTQHKDILSHLRRELMHNVWRFLLDDEFMHAYHYGIVILCPDGIYRRFYPRLFTYSADYPEKVLLATIRDMGLCPCPRCLTPKAKLHLMGTALDTAFRFGRGLRTYMASAVDRARHFIYIKGYGIGSVHVDNLLKETSSVPTVNAFIDRIGSDFPLHQMLVVDFMHEFELGVWKSLFTHLIRLLYAQPDGRQRVNELDARYRLIPSFGRQTIRRFTNDASEMKKLGARDFEDLLQCSIPVFDGLFPDPYDAPIMKLLYRLCEWHALAKLRMHTEPSLQHMDSLTKELGKLMRSFRDNVCTQFETKELPREVAARQRRAAQQPLSNNPPASTTAKSSRKVKIFNLNTYKYHAMPEYVAFIRLFGTTDNYTSQLGEHAHRVVKRLYRASNKRQAAIQIAQKVARMRMLRKRIAKRQHEHVPLDPDPAEHISTEDHHHVSGDRRHAHDLFTFTRDNATDPAVRNFIPKLKDHLLGRLLQRPFDSDDHDDFTDNDRNCIRVVNSKIFSVQRLTINYTTYDLRRDRDCVNPGRQCNVMVQAPEDQSDRHPYWYAKVLGVFHARVLCLPSPGSNPSIRRVESQSMAFLWVRWYGEEPGYRSGSRFARMHKIGFVPEDDPSAFGFLDPALVIRACHLMPAFADGRTSDLMRRGHSKARGPEEIDDWTNFYVGSFVDRDMFMRYYPGGGIGHRLGGRTAASERGNDNEQDIEEDEGEGEVGDLQADSGSESDMSEDDEAGSMDLEGDEEDTWLDMNDGVNNEEFEDDGFGDF